MVGVGASAGGLDAFQRFLKEMPAHPGIALVYVQHLDPTHASLLPELLGRDALMPVQAVRDETAVEPGNVYVIPPNTSLTIERGVLHLGPRLAQAEFGKPVDGFFTSLAKDQGDRAAGIVLSGTGSDGSLGLAAIKEHGGLTLAQLPESAAYDSMPRSAIAAGVVDHALPPEEMPAKLIERASGAEMPAAPEAKPKTPADAIARICTILYRKTGHDFTYYKPNTVIRRINLRMDELQVRSPAEYAERLEQDPEEAGHLLREMLITVTQFFRDPEAFDALAHKVIPGLFEGKAPEEQVRVWVVGCSSGQEAYSLAVLLREQAAGMEAPPRVQIFATDIDEDALATARAGRYPETIAEHVSPARLERFFTREDGHYRIHKDLRDLCVFSTHNLIHDPPFPQLDLISCRNLLIYLNNEIQGKVFGLFHYALRPGGFLFLGAAESVASRNDLFASVDRSHRVYQRRDLAFRTPVELPISWRAGRERPSAAPGHPYPAASEMTLQRNLERALLDEYTPAGMVVQEAGDIVYLFGPTGKYLAPSAGGNFSALNLVRKGLRPDLRGALKQAAQTQEPVLRPALPARLDGSTETVNLTVRPFAEAGAGLYLVVFQEVARPAGEQPGAARPAADASRAHEADAAAVEQLQHELRSTREQLQATIEEVGASNQELQSANEELLSMNEELQSSNEELQTSKEEVQSVNEELQSVNAELTQKVDELDTARSDLESLFEGTQIATVFLDNDLRIKRFTPTATELFRLREGDVGRPVTDITVRFANGDVEAEIREVLRSLQRREVPVRRADDGTHYLMRILPYRTRQDAIDGVVLAFVDVTDLKRTSEALRASEERFRTAVENLLDAFAIWSPLRDEAGETVDFRVEYVNGAACALTGRTRDELVGERVLEWLPGLSEAGLLDAIGRVAETGEPFMRDSVALQWDGEGGRAYDVRATRLGEGVAVAWRDVTDRHEAAELREMNQRKDEFLAMLGHELRNPLAAIASGIEVLRRCASRDPQSERARQVAERQVAHMTNLLNELLDTARITQGRIGLHRQPLDLREALEDAVQVVKPSVDARAQQLSVSLPPDPIPVEGDRDRLQQVAENLLTNANKYSPAGGRIRLSAEVEDGWAVVRVRDNGIGISPELLPHLFDLFVQAKRPLDRSQGGLGLGLTLVRRLVEMHGGTAEAHSEGEGKGSEFVVRLPLKGSGFGVQGSGEGSGFGVQGSGPEQGPGAKAQESGQETIGAQGSRLPEPRTLNPEPFAGRKILLVEDNADAAEVLGDLLELDGHEVVIAHDGPSALRLAPEYGPEVVLLDIGMPGMNGYEVARRLRADGIAPGTLLVALTGYGLDEDVERSRQAGFDLHLTKPVDLAELREVLGAGPVRVQG